MQIERLNHNFCYHNLKKKSKNCLLLGRIYMWYILITVLFLLPVFVGFGGIFEKIYKEKFSKISFTILAGLLPITVIWTTVSFFLPLNIWVEIITLFIGFSAFFWLKKYIDFWNFLSENKFSFGFISCVIIFFGSFYPFILDHFGYYVPTIKWLSEIGMVKGISNLDLILGQMSFWHVLQAGFSNFSDRFLRINVLILLVYAIYIFEKKSWLHLCFLPVLFLFSQSPSPDLPVIIFSLIILNEILSGNHNSAFLFLFSVFVFAIKPTMIWLPILSFFYSIIILKSNFKFVFPGFIILLLYFVKNFFAFGYPIFPVQFGDIGIPWKPNIEILKTSSELATEKTYDLQYKYSEIQQFTTLDYVKNWIFLEGIKSKIHLFFLFILVFFGVFTYYKKNKIVTLIFTSILIKSFLVLFFSAQYRFFVDVFFVVAFVVFYQILSKQKSVFISCFFSIFVAIVLSFPVFLQKYLPSFKLGFYMGNFQFSQLYEPSNYKLQKFRTYQIGNLKFNVVKDYPLSFDTPIPAISPSFLKEYYDAEIFPQKKSENLKSGFHWKKINKLEKNKLKIILNELKIETQ